MESSPPTYKARDPMSIPDGILLSRILDERSKMMDERSKILDERSKLFDTRLKFSNPNPVKKEVKCDLNKVYTHPSGGNLYIGNKDSIEPVISKEVDISLVCTMFGSENPEVDGVEFINEPIDDRPSEALAFMKAAEKLSEPIITALQGGKNVLVRCHMGISRSAGVAIYSLLTLHPEKSYQDVLSEVQEHRRCVCPNLGFEIALSTHFRRE